MAHVRDRLTVSGMHIDLHYLPLTVPPDFAETIRTSYEVIVNGVPCGAVNQIKDWGRILWYATSPYAGGADSGPWHGKPVGGIRSTRLMAATALTLEVFKAQPQIEKAVKLAAGSS